MNPSDMLTVNNYRKRLGMDRYLIWYYVRKLGIPGERWGRKALLLSRLIGRIKIACGSISLSVAGVTTQSLPRAGTAGRTSADMSAWGIPMTKRDEAGRL